MDEVMIISNQPDIEDFSQLLDILLLFTALVSTSSIRSLI